jgi:hypothetical protein
MGRLITAPNLAGADDVYEALLGLTAGLDEAASLRAQAKLILMLANHIGDPEAIAEAVALSRPTPDGAGAPKPPVA